MTRTDAQQDELLRALAGISSKLDALLEQRDARNALAVSVPDAARLLGLSERLVWGLLRTSALRSLRMGSRTLIAVAELERFVNDLERAA